MANVAIEYIHKAQKGVHWLFIIIGYSFPHKLQSILLMNEAYSLSADLLVKPVGLVTWGWGFSFRGAQVKNE